MNVWLVKFHPGWLSLRLFLSWPISENKSFQNPYKLYQDFIKTSGAFTLNTMGRLQGKVALITGAGSGFGEAIAKFYSKEGAHVIIADIATVNGQRVTQEINEIKREGYGEAVFVQFDCTKPQAWRDGLKVAQDRFGKLDIVVNNAGTTYKKKPSTEVTEEEFDQIIAVNTKSIYQSVVIIMPYFVERKSGTFLNTSSVAGYKTRPGMVFYGGTKGFVNTVRNLKLSKRRNQKLMKPHRSLKVWLLSTDRTASE